MMLFPGGVQARSWLEHWHGARLLASPSNHINESHLMSRPFSPGNLRSITRPGAQSLLTVIWGQTLLYIEWGTSRWDFLAGWVGPPRKWKIVTQMSHDAQPCSYSPACAAPEQGFDCILMIFPTAELQRGASKNASIISLPCSKKWDKAGIIQAFRAQSI